MGRLRLSANDPDAEFVASCTAAANDLVDRWLERTDPESAYPPLVAPYPAAVSIAASNVAIKLFRGKDAASDVAETWDATAPPREARDPLAAEVPKLAPYRNPAGWAPR